MDAQVVSTVLSCVLKSRGCVAFHPVSIFFVFARTLDGSGQGEVVEDHEVFHSALLHLKIVGDVSRLTPVPFFCFVNDGLGQGEIVENHHEVYHSMSFSTVFFCILKWRVCFAFDPCTVFLFC